MLVRDGCHLCVEAVEMIAKVCAEAGATWVASNVDSDPDLRAKFTDHVPVTFVDGTLLSYWFVDADELRSRLA